ncbi:MAG TPA: hypothetical protein VMS92_06950 [Mycobacterium sp.]|nr:hypothetical protein [Mycobacterium sp.]
MNTTRYPSTSCPHCGYKMDAASPVEGTGVPSEGDFSVCINCAGLMVFTHDMTLRKFGEADYEELVSDTDVCRRLLTVRDLIKRIKDKA